MAVTIFTRILKDTYHRKFLSLLVTILLYLGFIPIISRFVRFKFLLDIFFSAVLLSAIFAVSAIRYTPAIPL
jgi:hypothetical protein